MLATSLCVYFACSKANKEEVKPDSTTAVPDVDLANPSAHPDYGNIAVQERVSCGVGECHCEVYDSTGASDLTICGLTSGSLSSICNVNSTAPCVGNNQTVYAGFLPLSQLYFDFCVFAGRTFRITNNANSPSSFAVKCSGNTTPQLINIAANGSVWFDLTSCAAAQCN